MPRSTPDSLDVRAELLDLLTGSGLVKTVVTRPRRGVGPVAGGVVADRKGADVAIMQVGEAFVEIFCVVGGAVVARFEALRQS